MTCETFLKNCSVYVQMLYNIVILNYCYILGMRYIVYLVIITFSMFCSVHVQKTFINYQPVQSIYISQNQRVHAYIDFILVLIKKGENLTPFFRFWVPIKEKKPSFRFFPKPPKKNSGQNLSSARLYLNTCKKIHVMIKLSII